MSSKAEIRAHNQKTRDDFWSLLESLVRESTAPLEERDNSNQEVTRRLFEEDGRSNFEHQAWRETEMLHAMIRLHQDRYLKLNPEEWLNSRTGNECTPSLEERVKHEQEIDNAGATEMEWQEKRKLIAATHTRTQLETWAAEQHLFEDDSSAQKTKSRTSSPEIQSSIEKNDYPYLSFEELKKELLESRHSTASINKSVERSIRDAAKKQQLPFPMSGCSTGYQIITIGKERTKSGNPSKLHCQYQKRKAT